MSKKKVSVLETKANLPLFDPNEFTLNLPTSYDPQFQKPSELIYIHNNLDDFPRRLWNVLLWKSRPLLLSGEREFRFHMSDLVKVLSRGKYGTRHANYDQIRDAMEKLRVAPVVMLKRSGKSGYQDEITRCGFISGFTWDSGEGLAWRYDERLLKYLLSSNNISLLDIGVVTDLKSKHAQALYEICCQLVLTPEQIMFDIPTAVRLISGNSDYYVDEPRFFKSKCLDPALDDVNNNSEFIVEPIFQRNKFKKLEAVGWKVRLKDDMPESLRAPVILTDEMKEGLRATEVYDKLFNQYGFTDSFAIQILTKYPYDEQAQRYENAFKRVEDYKEYCVKANIVIDNLGAVTYKAIDSGIPYEGKTVFDPKIVQQEKIAKQVEQRMQAEQATRERSVATQQRLLAIEMAISALEEKDYNELIEEFKSKIKIKVQGDYTKSKLFLGWVLQNRADLAGEAS